MIKRKASDLESLKTSSHAKGETKVRKPIYNVVIGILFLAPILVSLPKMAAAREPVKVQMLTAPMGTGAYYFAFKLGEEINRKHPWLRLEVKEGMGTVPQMLEVMNNPKLGKTTIWNTVSAVVQFARTGTPPFKKTYSAATGSEVMMAFNTYPNLMCLATTNPEIKSIEDLAGKRIVLSQKGMSGTYLYEKILEKKGLLKKVKLQHMGYGPAADALRDGLADAVILVGYITSKPDEFSVMAAYHELFNTRTVYPVSLGDPNVLQALVKDGVPVHPAIIPKDAKIMGKATSFPVTTYYQGVCYTVDKIMDEEIVYEVVKSAYEYLDEVREAHPSLKVITREKLANVDEPENFHPGAVRLFKEKGIRLGYHGL